MTADTASRPIPDGIPCPPRLALVGDRSLDVQAHGRIPSIVDFVNSSSGDPIEVYWLHSSSLSQPADVTGFDGVWVVPGSPYENMAGVLSAIEGARSSGYPVAGDLWRLPAPAARVCPQRMRARGCRPWRSGPGGRSATHHALGLLPARRGGHGGGRPGHKGGGGHGGGPVTERFFCRFGLNLDYLEVLVANGLVFSGRDERGDPRIAELPGHPFFVGSLFQPELSSGSGWAHPLIVAFAAAVREHAQSSPRTRAVAAGAPA